jgi:hypothetical protein
MPYIKQEDRKTWDIVLKPLIANLSAANSKDKIDKLPPGEINYCLSKIIWALFDANPSYTNANNLVGVLECVKQEFIRRKLNFYEDQKITEHGDIQ